MFNVFIESMTFKLVIKSVVNTFLLQQRQIEQLNSVHHKKFTASFVTESGSDYSIKCIPTVNSGELMNKRPHGAQGYLDELDLEIPTL